MSHSRAFMHINNTQNSDFTPKNAQKHVGLCRLYVGSMYAQNLINHRTTIE